MNNCFKVVGLVVLSLSFVLNTFCQENKMDVRFNNPRPNDDGSSILFDVEAFAPENIDLAVAGATFRFVMTGLENVSLDTQIFKATSTTILYNNSTWTYGFTYPRSQGPSGLVPADGNWHIMGILRFDVENCDGLTTIDWSVCEEDDFPCSYASEWLDGQKPEPLLLTEHVNLEVNVSNMINVAPDAIDPFNPNNKDDVIYIPMEIGDVVSGCFDFVDNPNDLKVNNTISYPLVNDVDPTIGELQLNENICLGYKAIAAGIDTVEFDICDECGLCDRIQLIVDVKQASSVRENKVKVDYALKAFPNPAQDYIDVTVDINKSFTATLMVLDDLGRKVLVQNWENGRKAESQRINVSNLAVGLYTVVFDSNVFTEEVKFAIFR